MPPLLPFGSPPAADATRTTRGRVFLGAFCYDTIPDGVIVKPDAGTTMLQAGGLTLLGAIDLTNGAAIVWVS